VSGARAARITRAGRRLAAAAVAAAAAAAEALGRQLLRATADAAASDR